MEIRAAIRRQAFVDYTRITESLTERDIRRFGGKDIYSVIVSHISGSTFVTVRTAAGVFHATRGDYLMRVGVADDRSVWVVEARKFNDLYQDIRRGDEADRRNMEVETQIIRMERAESPLTDSGPSEDTTYGESEFGANMGVLP